MKNNLISYVMGILFGLGLCVSRMVDPSKVIGFLDVFGPWDPTLFFVMAGALIVSFPAFQYVGKCRKPVCADQFNLPTAKIIDKKLIIGSILFGIGWGLAGICPGPSVVSLGFAIPSMYIFFLAMCAGMFIFKFFLSEKA